MDEDDHVASSVPITDATGAFAVPSDEKSHYIDRDHSDVAYVRRILELGTSEHTPLGERLRFVAISSDVLDEFIAVRLDKIPMLQRSHLQQQIASIRHDQHQAVRQILDTMVSVGIPLQLAPWPCSDPLPDDLTLAFADNYLPALTPFTVDREHPFPFLRDAQSAVLLEFESSDRTPRHMVVPVPKNLGQVLWSTASPGTAWPVESVIAAQTAQLAPGGRLAGTAVVRVIRASDLSMADDFDDLRDEVARSLDIRSRNPVVCVEITEQAPAGVIRLIEERLLGATGCICRCPWPGAAPFGALLESAKKGFEKYGVPNGFYPKQSGQRPASMRDGKGILAAMRAGDFLLHWPYHDFELQIELQKEAARDPLVTTIKQTLYRTDDVSIEPLIMAARNGKDVTAVLELEARENEQENVAISRALEAAGVHVVYGLVGLKVHAKLLLVVRREEDGLREYGVLSTGNFHTGNAQHYSDLSLFTARRELGRDLTRLFHYITGSLDAPDTRVLVVAPTAMRDHLLRRIENEAANAAAGKPSGIWLKLNSLLDRRMIDALYAAAQAGVPIRAVIRRHCALRPGIADLSAGIQVKSIMGRYLEHARIVCFANGAALPSAQAEVYLSSADWMPRNFDERVEVLIPILDPSLRMGVMAHILDANFRDTDQSWVLRADGSYERETPTGFDAQSRFIDSPFAV